MTATAIGILSGALWDPWKPDPALIDLDMLDRVLRAVPRFGGHTTRVISIAEHCLRVRRITKMLGKGTVHAERWALLHDAHEALTPWGDCLSPGKTDQMKGVESMIDGAIVEALGIPWPSEYELDLVKRADAIALYYEALLWAPSAPTWAPSLPGQPYSVAQVEAALPLIWPTPGEDWLREVERLL